MKNTLKRVFFILSVIFIRKDAIMKKRLKVYDIGSDSIEPI